MNMPKKKPDDRYAKIHVAEIKNPSPVGKIPTANAIKMSNSQTTALEVTPSSTRNMNFFIDASDHRVLRSHSIETNRSLQSIMAEALNLYLAQHGLGPIKLVKAYRV